MPQSDSRNTLIVRGLIGARSPAAFIRRIFTSLAQLARIVDGMIDRMQHNGTQMSALRKASGNCAPAATVDGCHAVGPVTFGPAAICLHDVLEKQAKRMAQSLHDEAGQLLAAVFLKLDELNRKLPEGQRGCIGDLTSLLCQMEERLRRISHELRPMVLDDLGLLPAVEFLKQGYAKRTGLSIVLEGSIPGRVPPNLEMALYRIVHQALGNIADHPCAKRVRIAFHKDHRIQCTVHDDGIGYDPGEVSAIRERVEDLSGTLSVQSSPGFGTKLVVSIPL